MGELLLFDGDVVKAGTCEDLFYIRYQEMFDLNAAGRLKQYGSNETPETYLGGEFRFRFPFPWEDGTSPFEYDYPNNGYDVDVTDIGLESGNLQATTDGRIVLTLLYQRPVAGVVYSIWHCAANGSLLRMSLAESLVIASYLYNSQVDAFAQEIAVRIMEGFGLLPFDENGRMTWIEKPNVVIA